MDAGKKIAAVVIALTVRWSAIIPADCESSVT